MKNAVLVSSGPYDGPKRLGQSGVTKIPCKFGKYEEPNWYEPLVRCCVCRNGEEPLERVGESLYCPKHAKDAQLRGASNG
jgi:hypothetical protein